MKLRLTIQSKLLMAAFGILLVSGAILLVFNVTSVYQKLASRLQLRGVTIANLMAQDVINRMLTENFLALELMFKDRLGDEQDIEYAYVTNKSGAVVAHTFENGFPMELKGKNPVPAGQDYATMSFATEKNSLIDIAIPLLKGEVGQFHIGLSETSIRKQAKDIVWPIVWLISATMIFAAVVFTILARIITRPLLGLAKTADQVSHGDFNIHFDVSSNDEIGHLAGAFNNMIAARKQIEDDREKVIAELQTALLEIKTLSGLLPICAWCKKIRDDKGYWKMVDIYMADHLDVEFTHGKCPDCLKDVSKETYERLKNDQKSAEDSSASHDNS
ncbi:MAG: HAMP domain-containing protein [Nitrospirota bacterium]|nr:HAMP domain-containing protein [Nitrospirota bacterium]